MGEPPLKSMGLLNVYPGYPPTRKPFLRPYPYPLLEACPYVHAHVTIRYGWNHAQEDGPSQGDRLQGSRRLSSALVGSRLQGSTLEVRKCRQVVFLERNTFPLGILARGS